MSLQKVVITFLKKTLIFNIVETRALALIQSHIRVQTRERHEIRMNFVFRYYIIPILCYILCSV